MPVATEFFDTAEVALNAGDQSWGNLGLWQDEDSYSDACRGLALALGIEAGLDAESHVFDAGFGCGDQLLLWLEHFHVATLQGVNLSETQTRRALDLLKRHGHHKHCETLRQGDIHNSAHWPAPGAPRPNRVLCLDGAYHFPGRASFLAQAGRSLAPGGVLCVTDFVLPESFQGGLRSLPLHAMLRGSRIPRDNLVTTARYREQLFEAGFDQVAIRDLSESVMLGFSAWWARYHRRASHLPARSRLKYAVTARFLGWAYHKTVLRYVLISARRN